MKKINMKTIVLISMMTLFCSTFCASQNVTQVEKNNFTYKILNPELFQSVDSFILALDKADFSSHRLQDNSFIIHFDCGLEVEIFSAHLLLSNGLLSNQLDSYPEYFAAERYNSVFKFGDNDAIIEIRPTAIKKN